MTSPHNLDSSGARRRLLVAGAMVIVTVVGAILLPGAWRAVLFLPLFAVAQGVLQAQSKT
ncbi:MAG: hypothetical protein ACYTGN_02700 [Planctomycetota bacterium]